MKRTEPESIRQIIDRIVASSGNKQAYMAHRASSLWPDIVGPGVASLTSRRYVVGTTLHVFITSAALKNELSFSRQSIVDAINKSLGAEVITAIAIH